MCVNVFHIDVTKDFLKYSGLMQLFFAKSKTLMDNVYSKCLHKTAKKIIKRDHPEGLTEKFADDMKEVMDRLIKDIEKRLEKMVVSQVMVFQNEDFQIEEDC